MRLRIALPLAASALALLLACDDGLEPVTPPKPEPPPVTTPPPTGPDPSLPAFLLDHIASPVRAVATGTGRLLVADSRLRMVVRVDPASLQPDQGLRIAGKPSAVAILDQRIYVGNPDRQTVEIYRAQGGGSAGSFGSGAVAYPSDIAVDPGRGLVFVVDGRSQQVRVFTATGALVQVIGAPGPGTNQFLAPIGIAVDTARQEVLVSDYGAPPTVKAAVKIFRYDGSYVDQISGAGRCAGSGCSGGFSRPQGLAVSRLGKIFLADALLGQILVYDRAAKTLDRVLGGYPTLYVPVDVVIGKNDDVFVVSKLTARVVLFPAAASQ